LAGLVLAIALIGVVGQTAPTAHADADNSSNFLGALTSKGITFGSGQAAVAAGHRSAMNLIKASRQVTSPTK
jgi:hypothetical protein